MCIVRSVGRLARDGGCGQSGESDRGHAGAGEALGEGGTEGGVESESEWASKHCRCTRLRYYTARRASAPPCRKAVAKRALETRTHDVQRDLPNEPAESTTSP
jgi:hypothetical protein